MDRHTLQAAIDAIQAQRHAMGNAATDLALVPLRRLLAGLDADAPVAAGLRRGLVTVLFADTVDSTALAARLDPEDTLDIVGGMLERAAALVQAHGGRVLRFTGDGLKAAFGTDGAREDDALRAVQAGLAILAAARQHAAQVRKSHGVDGFALRLGVHTGLAVLGAGFEAERTLSGDAVHIAARMEQSAPPGALRISADTWALVRGRVDAQAQPPLQVKGLAEPLATWLVTGLRAGPHQRGVDGLAVPMVGRDAELARLGAARSARQAVLVLGDAGIGKTRLLGEALAGARTGGAAAAVLRAQAQPSDRLRPWGVLQQLVADHCGIADGDTAEQARARLLQHLAPALAPDGTRRVQVLGQLLGLDSGDAPALRGLDPRALRNLGLAALGDWLAWLARQPQPPVLVVEDLHWADDASLQALPELLRNGLPLAVWMTARPALLERDGGWTAPPGVERLELAALSAADGRLLAQALLAPLQPPSPSLQALLVGRADGNPYFMEETVRRLRDDGVLVADGAAWRFDEARLDLQRLPATLTGLLQARLDALPPAERRCAQQASIVGHVFWDAALAAVDDAAPAQLLPLEQRRWVHQQPGSAFDGTAERRFDHHLLHQVTYDTVLKAERRRGHRAVADWLHARTADREAQFIAITAEHAERAGDAALAADCYERAAGAAIARFANPLALHCLDRALALLAADDHRPRLRLLYRQSMLANRLGDRDLERRTHDAREAVLRLQPDPVQQIALLIDRSLLADFEGQPALSRQRADEALALADGLAPTPDLADHLAMLHGLLCWQTLSTHQFDRARHHQAELQRWADIVGDAKPLRSIQAAMMAGHVAAEDRCHAEARRHLQHTIVLAQQHHEPRSVIGARDALATIALQRADWSAAEDEARQMLEIAERVGDGPRSAYAWRVLAEAAWGAGDAQAARDAGQQGLALARRTRSVWLEGQCLTLLGLADDLAGAPAAARDHWQAARAVYAAIGGQDDLVHGLDAMLAGADLHLDGLQAALQRIVPVLTALAPLGGSVWLERLPCGWHAYLACHQVLAAAGDGRAGALLEAVRARLATQLAALADGPAEAAVLQARHRAWCRILPPGR